MVTMQDISPALYSTSQTDLRFRSSDGRYGFVITRQQRARILMLCRQATPNETGGILIGYYTHCLHWAILSDVSSATSDSVSGIGWFYRGTRGLQRLLLGTWKRKRHFYLGEWHFHPFGAAHPSRVDVEQMASIAGSANYHSPEPLLLLIGGEPGFNWEFRVFVFPQNDRWSELLAVDQETA